ncbi:expressed unknown protein [Seminavis robusta]|uniref:Uncharacterized protein n=1 Tax=Seminavis robusta TaxID=568900 RepID=A0A9N8E6H8_9STRA|nr:expressed unknown protein [Seminavis robusta]|eukprot:Sro724_g193180.1 n/a (101) ;mRNA; f:32613-32915
MTPPLGSSSSGFGGTDATSSISSTPATSYGSMDEFQEFQVSWKVCSHDDNDAWIDLNDDRGTAETGLMTLYHKTKELEKPIGSLGSDNDSNDDFADSTAL